MTTMKEQGQGEAGPSTIPLYLINGVATIWDAQTAATLHCQHDISGLRVGTLPGVSQQNGFLGLPMTLMQEETAHLVRSGICHLVPISPTPTIPSPDQVEHQKNLRINRIQNLERVAREEAEKNAQAAKEMFAKGGDKAKAKREERARLKAIKKGEGLFIPDTSIEGEGGGEGSSSSSKIDTKQSTSTSTSAPLSTSKPKQQPSPGYFHTVPSLPFDLPTSTSKSTSTTAKKTISIPNPLFHYPSTPQQCANLQTFSSLSSLSYRMGLGPRFGGEYLIYPGDYLRYHAHFTSQVVLHDSCIKPMEIVAWGRLGTGTKKAGLICCVSSERTSERSELDEFQKSERSEVDELEKSERSEIDELGKSERSEIDELEKRERSESGQGHKEHGDRIRAGKNDVDHELVNDEEKGGVEFYSLEWANFG